MKQTLFIFALITASIQTFAQSPRIKLNQITKDSVTGSVLISSPTDSGMVYSRDLFISYGADTVLILNGDTIAATSGIISSVLSDGVTITGDGTVGSPLKVDTATVIATKQDLDSYYLDSNPDGYTSNTGTVTSVGGTGTVNGISLSGSVTSSGNLTLGGTLSGVDLASQVTGTLPVANGGTGSATQNFVDLTNAQTVGGAKTFSTAIVVNEDGNNVNTRFEGDTDANLLFLDASTNRVGIGTNSPQGKLNIYSGAAGGGYNSDYDELVLSNSGRAGINILSSATEYSAIIMGGKVNNSTGGIYHNAANNMLTLATQDAFRLNIDNAGDVGIGTTTPAYKLDVNGNVRADTYYYDVGSSLVSSSDVRLKKNIFEMQSVLSKINALNLVRYQWNDVMYKKLEGRSSQSKLSGTFEGMIAQEVESIFPEYVGVDADGYKTLSYVSFIVPLIKATQEQQSEIDLLKNLIQSLTTRIENIENN